MGRVVCLGLLIALVVPVGVSAGNIDALDWLVRSRSVAQQLDYRGEFVRQRGLEVSRTQILHRGSGKQEQERLRNLDGEPRESLRFGNEIRNYLPSQQRVITERSVAETHFPSLLPFVRSQLQQTYLIHTFAGHQVAGREAMALALDARDRFHYSYRFWFDRATGLLLRTQTVSEDGEVVEQVGFRTLTIGPLSSGQLTSTWDGIQGWRVDPAERMRPVDLSDWRVGWVPYGFVRAATISRRLNNVSGKPREVLQIIYTNRLASLSVFIEPWSAERSLSPLRLGALNMVGKRHGKFWLTIVGDVPMAAVRHVADTIELAQTTPK